MLVVDLSPSLAGGKAYAIEPISDMTNFIPPRTMSPLVPNSISIAMDSARLKDSVPESSP